MGIDLIHRAQCVFQGGPALKPSPVIFIFLEFSMSDTLDPKAAARQAARSPDTAPAITFWDVSEAEQARARAAARPEDESSAEQHADFWGVGQSFPDAATQSFVAEKTVSPEVFGRAHPEGATAPVAIDLTAQSEGVREAILRSASDARTQDAETTLLRDLTRATERFLTATGSALKGGSTQEFQAIQALPALAQFLIQEFVREVKMVPAAPHPDETVAIENAADHSESAQNAPNLNDETPATPHMTREELAQAFHDRLRARKAPAAPDAAPTATPASARPGI